MKYIGSKRLKLQDDDFDAILSEASKNGYTLPSHPKNLLRLIVDMKSIGLWSALDAFYVFAGDAGSDFKCINLIDPGRFDATSYNSPIFSTAGVAGGTGNGYLSTGINPTDITLKAKQNDTLIMAVVENAVLGGGASNPHSTIWGLDTSFSDAYSTYRQWRRLNGEFNDETTLNIPGLFAIARTGALTGWSTQKETEQTLTNNSNALQNNTRTIFRQSTNYGRGTVSCYATGASVAQSIMQKFRNKYNYFLLKEGQSQIA